MIAAQSDGDSCGLAAAFGREINPEGFAPRAGGKERKKTRAAAEVDDEPLGSSVKRVAQAFFPNKPAGAREFVGGAVAVAFGAGRPVVGDSGGRGHLKILRVQVVRMIVFTGYGNRGQGGDDGEAGRRCFHRGLYVPYVGNERRRQYVPGGTERMNPAFGQYQQF